MKSFYKDYPLLPGKVDDKQRDIMQSADMQHCAGETAAVSKLLQCSVWMDNFFLI